MSAFIFAGLCLMAATLASARDDEDTQLFLAFQRGDHAAFETLFKRHERGVVSFIYRHIRDSDRAQELGQETFMRAIRNVEGWRPEARFRTWLFTIARNLCADEARRMRHRQSKSLDAPSIADDESSASAAEQVQDLTARSPAQEPVRAEFRERLHGLLRELPEAQREVFLLRHFEGLRFTEIAAMQGISENTVKSRMRYALQSLRAALADYEGVSLDGEDLAAANDQHRHV